MKLKRIIMINNMSKFLRIWLAGFLIILFLQLLGGGIPEYQDTYFYIGYYSAPILLSFSITFISYHLLNLLRSKP